MGFKMVLETVPSALTSETGLVLLCFTSSSFSSAEVLPPVMSSNFSS